MIRNQFQPFTENDIESFNANQTGEESEYKIIRKLKIPKRFNEHSPPSLQRGLVVDVETTGFNQLTDEVIQLAMLAFDYDPDTGKIYEVHLNQAYSEFNEPMQDIPHKVTQITGITKDMTLGHSLNTDCINEEIARADLIIAHNAQFDRSFCEKITNRFQDKLWSCSFSSVNWQEHGFSAGKLDYLGMQFGWFYERHRADADCEACVALLSMTLDKTGKTVLSYVIENASRVEYILPAYNSAYEQRFKLKDRGYVWVKDQNVWVAYVCEKNLDEEKDWLKKEIYGSSIRPLRIKKINPHDRYTDRIFQSLL